MPETVAGLEFQHVTNSANDVAVLSQAFMLNDNGDGSVDPTLQVGGATGQTCSNGGGTGTYCTCLSKVNVLLNSGVESHACARYLAAHDMTHDPSGDDDADYSLKFVDCSTIPGYNSGNPPDDMTYQVPL